MAVHTPLNLPLSQNNEVHMTNTILDRLHSLHQEHCQDGLVEMFFFVNQNSDAVLNDYYRAAVDILTEFKDGRITDITNVVL